MTKRLRFSKTTSSERTGRCAMSTGVLPSHGRPPYDASCTPGCDPGPCPGSVPGTGPSPPPVRPDRGQGRAGVGTTRGEAPRASGLRVVLDDELLGEHRVD